MLKVESHINDGLQLLTSQFKDKPIVVAMLTAFLKQVQDLENAIFDVHLKGVLDSAFGKTLDLIGSDVGQPRVNGLADNDYRPLIYAKIGQNISKGNPETLKSIYRFLTEGTRTQYSDNSVGFSVYSDGELSKDSFKGTFEAMNSIKKAGKRVERLGTMRGESGFAFSGNLGGQGFGSGKFAYSYNYTRPFRFIGTNRDGQGFKNSSDPYTGGGLA